MPSPSSYDVVHCLDLLSNFDKNMLEKFRIELSEFLFYLIIRINACPEKLNKLHNILCYHGVEYEDYILQRYVAV
jgi:hypothetical protein